MLAVVNCRLIIDVYTITKLMNINKTTCHSGGLLQSIPDLRCVLWMYVNSGDILSFMWNDNVT